MSAPVFRLSVVMSEAFNNLKYHRADVWWGSADELLRGLRFSPILVWFGFSTILPFRIRDANLCLSAVVG